MNKIYQLSFLFCIADKLSCSGTATARSQRCVASLQEQKDFVGDH